MELQVINEAARKIGMSELARRTGLSRSYLYTVLEGSSSPTLETLGKIASALGYELELRKAPLEDSIRDVSSKTARDGQWKIHFFNFVDAFRRRPSLDLVSEAPFSELDERYRALLAAMTWALCDQEGIKAPAWAKAQPALKEPWFVSGMENLKAISIVESPAQFKQKNIFVLDNFLSRA